MTATAHDVERTSRDTTIAQWGVASVVMAGSAAAGGFAFHHLHEPPVLGVVTALAVDLALAAWLLIGRRLRAAGVTSRWGTVLELATMGMTLYLNIGAAVFKGVDPETAKVLLGIAHGFLPVTLVLVTMAGGEAHLKLLRIRHDREAHERAEKAKRMAVELARREADQKRIGMEQDNARLERLRLAELGAATHERDMADQRETREHEARQTIASFASVLAIGAALRRRPRPRTKTTTQRRPKLAPDPPPRAVPAPVPVTEELLSQARQLRARRASQGESAGRAVLQRELGVPERTARELARRLDEQPLRVLVGGGE